MAECKQMTPNELGEEMRKMIKKLYGKFLNDTGTKVDYSGMKNSKEFQDYEKMATQLQRTDISQLPENGRIAFFINIYNALIIHGQVTTPYLYCISYTSLIPLTLLIGRSKITKII